jgi:hypothetical protein
MNKKLLLTLVDFFGEFGARAIDVFTKLVLISLVGAAMIALAPWVVDPARLGSFFAQQCVNAGQCDYNSLLIGLGLGIFLLVAVTLFLIGTLQGGPRSLNDDVMNLIRKAGAEGVTAARIALLSDIAHDDVIDIVTCLVEDGQIARKVKDDKTVYLLSEPA